MNTKPSEKLFLKGIEQHPSEKAVNKALMKAGYRSNDIIRKCSHATVKIAEIAVIALYCRVMHFIHSAVEELVRSEKQRLQILWLLLC